MGTPYPNNDDPDFNAKFDKAWDDNFHERWPAIAILNCLSATFLLVVIGCFGLFYPMIEFTSQAPFTSTWAIRTVQFIGGLCVLLGIICADIASDLIRSKKSS